MSTASAPLASVPLTSPPATSPNELCTCSNCRADVTHVDMRRGGHVLQFVSCSACETREWFQDGRPVILDEVLLAVGEKSLAPADMVGPAHSPVMGNGTGFGPASVNQERRPGQAGELRHLLDFDPDAPMTTAHSMDGPSGATPIAAPTSHARSELVESLTMPISLQDLASMLDQGQRSAA